MHGARAAENDSLMTVNVFQIPDEVKVIPEAGELRGRTDGGEQGVSSFLWPLLDTWRLRAVHGEASE